MQNKLFSVISKFFSPSILKFLCIINIVFILTSFVLLYYSYGNHIGKDTDKGPETQNTLLKK